MKVLEVRADNSEFFVTLVGGVAPFLRELRVSIVEDVRPDDALSKAFQKLEVLESLKINFVGTISERKKLDAGATLYESLLARTASLESLQAFELTCSAEYFLDGRTKAYAQTLSRPSCEARERVRA